MLLTVEAFKNYWEQQTKGEDRGKPSLKRTRREDVPDVHRAIKLDTGGGDVMQEQNLKKESEEVDILLEELLLKWGWELYEKKLLLEFQQFDGRSEKLELWRSIQRMKNLAENDPRNIALRAQLRSKRKILLKRTSSTPVSTPPESDDDEGDAPNKQISINCLEILKTTANRRMQKKTTLQDSSELNFVSLEKNTRFETDTGEKMYEKEAPEEDKIAKVEEAIKLAETTKNGKKIKKAEKFTPSGTRHHILIQEKIKKPLKSQKMMTKLSQGGIMGLN